MATIYTIPEDKSKMPVLKCWTVQSPAKKRAAYDHCHIQFEISYFASGKGTYTTADKSYPIKAGDIFVFSSNEKHNISEVSAPIELYNIHFDPRYLSGGTYNGLSRNNAGFCFSHSTDFENRIPFGSVENQRLMPLLTRVFDEMHERKSEYELLVHSTVCEIAVTLIRYCGYLHGTGSVTTSGAKTVQKVIKFIDRHLTEPITLGDVASAAALSPNYLSALFKNICNISLWEYICNKRIELAMRLIDLNRDIKVIELCEKCGFNTTANFNKMFRKYAGCTPSEYKKFGINAFIDI